MCISADQWNAMAEYEKGSPFQTVRLPFIRANSDAFGVFGSLKPDMFLSRLAVFYYLYIVCIYYIYNAQDIFDLTRNLTSTSRRWYEAHSFGSEKYRLFTVSHTPLQSYWLTYNWYCIRRRHCIYFIWSFWSLLWLLQDWIVEIEICIPSFFHIFVWNLRVTNTGAFHPTRSNFGDLFQSETKGDVSSSYHITRHWADNTFFRPRRK